MTQIPDQLPPDLLQLLAQRGDVKRVRRGASLVEEGDAAESLFILLSGRLNVFTRDDRGREVIYNELAPGEILGEMFLDGGARSASVRAVTDVECVEVRGSHLREFMRAYPEFSETLVVKLIERLRRATTQIRSLALDDVFDRTVHQINELAVQDHGVRYLPTEVTQQQIASRIGATREMVNRVFRKLIGRGHLVRHARGLAIPSEIPRH